MKRMMLMIMILIMILMMRKGADGRMIKNSSHLPDQLALSNLRSFFAFFLDPFGLRLGTLLFNDISLAL